MLFNQIINPKNNLLQHLLVLGLLNILKANEELVSSFLQKFLCPFVEKLQQLVVSYMSMV